MTVLRPITLGERVTALLGKYFWGDYRPKEIEPFELKLINREIERISENDRVTADRLLIDLKTWLYEVDDCLLLIENIKRNGRQDLARTAQLQLNSNFLFATDAHSIVRDSFDNPGDQGYHELFSAAAAVGAFREIASAVERSVQSNVVLLPSPLIEISRQAQDVLNSLGVSDKHIARCIDMAGEVLRKNSLLWLGSGPDYTIVPVEAGLPCLSMEYRVPVSASVASSMTWDLYDKLIDANLDVAGLSIGFMGVRELEAAHDGH